MPFGPPSNVARTAPGSWLARLFTRPHPDAFRAGIHEGGRWRFRLSAVDPYQPRGVVTMRWGDLTLRIRPDDVRGDGPRPGYVILTATEDETRRLLELSVPLGDVVRFGLEL